LGAVAGPRYEKTGDVALAAKVLLALSLSSIAAKRRRNGKSSLPYATASAIDVATPSRARAFACPLSLPLFGLLLLSRP